MNRIRTLLVALLSIAVLAAGFGGAPTVAVQPQTTPTMVATVAEIRRESRPELRREEAPITAILGSVDSGGTLQHQNFRSGKEVVETDGTEITYSGQHFVGFTQTDRRGTREAPVATVAHVRKATSPVDSDGAAIRPGTIEFPLREVAGTAVEQAKYEGMYA